MTAISSAVTAELQSSAVESYGTIRVAFQGELGAYGDEAIAQHWRGAATSIPSPSFQSVITEVEHGRADFGILPVWNTIVGDIAPGRIAVQLGCSSTLGLVIVGDAHVIVRHQLLALPGSTLDTLDTVSSHPVALAQCGRFLAAHPHIIANPVYDTAGAARDLAMSRAHTSAAIAGPAAAKLYGLVALRADIQDVSENITRFLIVTAPGNQYSSLDGVQAEEIPRW